MKTCSVLLGLYILLSLLPAHAHGDTFYSGNVRADVVLELDTATGIVTALGPFGWAISAPMAVRDGQLHWIRRTPCVGDFFQTYFANVDPTTLSFSGEITVTDGGTSVFERWVGGLAFDGSNFLIALGPGSCDPPDHIAAMSVTGELSSLTDLSSFGAEFDLLAVSPSGDLYAIDDLAEDATPTANLYRIQLPATVQLIGTIPHSSTDPNRQYSGMDFSLSGNMWLLEKTGFDTWIMRRIDPATGGVLEDVPLTYTVPPGFRANIFGLAPSPGIAVPVEHTSWGRVKTMYR